MTRAAIIMALVVAIFAAGFFVGQRWDDAAKERAKNDTTERVNNADVSEGNTNDDDAFNRDFLDGL